MTRLEVPDAKSKARWNSPTQSPRRRGEMESGNVTMSHHRPELRPNYLEHYFVVLQAASQFVVSPNSKPSSSLKFALGNADSNPDTRATHPSEFATQMSSPNLCASLYLRVAIFHSISPPGRDLVLYTPIWRPRTLAADEAMKLGRLIRLQEFMRRQHRWEQRPVRDMLKSAGLAISLLCPACHK
ncbi:hypothetical protein FB451DRAFT_1183017 [Mycena latifolia]|nr:hypothetical protein FB451DRAFT_1183017 [Mycena latifolia]